VIAGRWVTNLASHGLEYTHDEQPEQAKKMIIDALRFSEKNVLKAQRPELDDAD
jgi:hypothetical protein